MNRTHKSTKISQSEQSKQGYPESRKALWTSISDEQQQQVNGGKKIRSYWARRRGW